MYNRFITDLWQRTLITQAYNVDTNDNSSKNNVLYLRLNELYGLFGKELCESIKLVRGEYALRHSLSEHLILYNEVHDNYTDMVVCVCACTCVCMSVSNHS